jgi:hypothetical protein
MECVTIVLNNGLWSLLDRPLHTRRYHTSPRMNPDSSDACHHDLHFNQSAIVATLNILFDAWKYILRHDEHTSSLIPSIDSCHNPTILWTDKLEQIDRQLNDIHSRMHVLFPTVIPKVMDDFSNLILSSRYPQSSHCYSKDDHHILHYDSFMKTCCQLQHHFDHSNRRWRHHHSDLHSSSFLINLRYD